MTHRGEGPSKRMRAALARVRTASHLHDRGEHWLLPEAALVWSIWVQALTDYFGSAGCARDDRESAKRTAMTGLIVKPDGTEVNALELLGIDAEWAYQQVVEALSYKEAA